MSAVPLPPPAAPPRGPLPEQAYNLWYVGVFIMVIGTILQAGGSNLQRLSARREVAKSSDPKERKGIMKQPLAVMGIVMLVSGGIVSSTALVFSAQSILAPLILLIFISNPVFAHFLNGEPFNWRTDGLCTLCIAGSISLVIAYAPHHSASYDDVHLKYLFKQPAFVGFLAIVTASILSASYVKRSILKRLDFDMERLTELRDLAFVHISYGVLGGTFGGMNVTFVKAELTLIYDAFDRGSKEDGIGGGFREVFSSWILYVVGAGLLVTFFLEVKFTADGLQVASAMIVVSTLAVTEEVIATLGAIMFFQDYHYFTPLGAGMFTLGTVLGLASVIVMCVLRLRQQNQLESKAHIVSSQEVEVTQIDLSSASADQPLTGGPVSSSTRLDDAIP